MPRPKKSARETPDLRTETDSPILSPEEELSLSRICRQCTLDELRVDPHSDNPLSCCLAPVILKRGTPFQKELAAAVFISILEDGTAGQAEVFFKRVLQLKQNAEQLRHRNGFAYYAYSMFIEETGREPSKRELKKYIVARPEVYRDAPAPEDKKGWSRVWQACGLYTLPER